MLRRFALSLLVCLCAVSFAEEKNARTDVDGGAPLPAGAIRRLGSLRFAVGHATHAMALTPDDKTLLVGDGDSIRFFEMRTGKLTHSMVIEEAQLIHDLRVTPDGRYFVAQSDNQAVISRGPFVDESLVVGEIETGKIIRRRRIKEAECILGMPSDGELLLHTRGEVTEDRPTHTIRLVHLRSGELCHEFKEILVSCHSPTSDRVAVYDSKAKLTVWDVRKVVKSVRDFPAAAIPLETMALSPDGKHLALGMGSDRPQRESYPPLLLWEIRSGKAVWHQKDQHPSITDLRFSPDGRWLISKGSDGSVHLRESATGKSVRKLAVRQHRFSLDHRFSPDSRTLLYWRLDSSMTELDLSTLTERTWPGRARWFASALLTRDGRTLVTAGEGIRLWDMKTQRLRTPTTGHRSSVREVRFFDEGKLILSSPWDGMPLIWDRSKGTVIPTIPPTTDGSILESFFDEKKKILYTLDGASRLRAWSPGQARPLESAPLGLSMERVIFAEENLLFPSADRRWLVVKREEVFLDVWDLGEGRKVASAKCPSPIRAVKVGSLSERALTSDKEGHCRLWSLPDLKPLSSPFEKKLLKQLPRFSPDGKHILWGEEKKLRSWEITTDRIRHDLEHAKGPVRPLGFFDRGGELALTVSGNPAREHSFSAWNLKTGQRTWTRPGLRYHPFGTPDSASILRYPYGHVGWTSKGADFVIIDLETGRRCHEDQWLHGWDPSHVPFAPDGRIFAICNYHLRLIESATGKVIRELRNPHRGSIGTGVFSPDGEVLATAGSEGTILLWDWRALCGLRAEPGEKELSKLWERLRGKDVPAAYHAMGRMIARPEEAVRFLDKHLKPVGTEDRQRILALIKQLDSRRFRLRREATEKLRELGADARFLLQEALTRKPTLEMRRRIEEILSEPKIREWSPETLHKLRAMHVLEEIGSPRAWELLTQMAESVPESRVTREARAALLRQ